MRTEADKVAVEEFDVRRRRTMSDLQEALDLLGSSAIRHAEGHYRDTVRLEALVDQALEILGEKNDGRLLDGIRRLIAERDEARQAKLESEQRAGFAEACCGCDNGGEHVLPTPSPIKPEHWRFAAELIRKSGQIGSWTADNLEWQAQGMEAELAEAERIQDEAIESAITAYFKAAHGCQPKTVYPHVRTGMEAALRAASKVGENA
ncbi:hypothetical protein SEA_LOZINAK_94 [Gordonia phage Lozinak]|uniref:Uncharacterized protein n=3 Tax=Smoothievirus TaxID=1982557 RepID=A0A2D1GG70_9CAUD|nr:hypothetical protein BEN60_gp112 [Gordonia phage Smoothie]YP_009276207.1 hypothetical protein BH772_gp115 [Gordonia phage Bachita]YP_009281249.1 hypothetical protein BIZ74_gp110 [Gordonia phage Cucurbita]ATN90720.1 hypothetical protein SEA_LOZINAK_94 [Gordonia phage Lozinak]QKY79671.1 hypothetical protein SEA_ENGINEER_95 [Gordonia Phage Engineer]WKW85892.1 hypothetical protein SEA_PHINKBODEN_93 [Gordonia Phage PhinkBoden]ANA86251.1 hypothetical protein PBI_SMOOTHIE_95 [Gordonia phage Smoot